MKRFNSIFLSGIILVLLPWTLLILVSFYFGSKMMVETKSIQHETIYDTVKTEIFDTTFVIREIRQPEIIKTKVDTNLTEQTNED
jgi:hypothetical protein